MISEPKVNGLSDTNKETDYCPKKFNRFWVMLGGQNELLEFLDGIIGNFPADKAARVEFGDGDRQPFPGGLRDSFHQSCAGALQRGW